MKNHFVLMIIFSICTSLVLAFISKTARSERLKYFLILFLAFVALSVAAGWLMYPLPF